LIECARLQQSSAFAQAEALDSSPRESRYTVPECFVWYSVRLRSLKLSLLCEKLSVGDFNEYV
jgi:hypothetical protein